MQHDRRGERAARALLTHAETALTQAAANLFRGNMLSAMRGARLVEQLIALNAALEAKRSDAFLREAAFKQRLREIDERTAKLDQREEELRDDARKIRDFCQTWGLNHDALTGRLDRTSASDSCASP